MPEWELDAAVQQKLAAMFAANKDEVSIPKIYIDITGDMGAAAVLDELLFWTLPKRGTGKTSLRVFRNGGLWLAVRRSDWWERKRLTERQADTAIEKLIKLELVEKDVFLFDGKPTVHLRLKTHKFVSLYGDKMNEMAIRENDANLARDIADLYAMMGFPHENVISNSQNREMLNLQNGEIINIPLHPENTSSETGKKKLPANSGLDWLMASGASPEEIAAANAKDEAERDLLFFYEQKMGYGTTLDWWGKNADLTALRKFLVAQTKEDIEVFAKWCARPYSKFRPEDAARYPRQVIIFWPLAFKEAENNSAPAVPKFVPPDESGKKYIPNPNKRPL